MIILGAGMAGCIAAIMNPNAEVLEAATSAPDNHNAVLRFRSDDIAKITGVNFRKVKVYKSIYHDGQFHHQANPLLSNLYSQKISGKIMPRSIWDLRPVERFIAPPNFHLMMLDMINSRITYGAEVKGITEREMFLSHAVIGRKSTPIISTIPMPVMARLMNEQLLCGLGPESFSFKSIYTERWHVEDCDTHQTIYFPGSKTPLYRATLTGSELILEATGGNQFLIDHACEALGIDTNLKNLSLIKSGEQKYGKIAPVDDAARKMFMFDLTQAMDIYSLGRFACWRNILLDDVYNDVFKIRHMIRQSSYDVRKEI